MRILALELGLQALFIEAVLNISTRLQAVAPVPISGSRPKNTPRKVSTASKRRRSVSTFKDAEYSASMPAPRLAGNLLDDDMDEDDLADGPDGEVRSKIKGKRTKKGQEVFQCEKCSKVRRSKGSINAAR